VSNLSGLTDDEAQETDAVSSSSASSINNSTTRRAVIMPSTVSNTNASNVSLPFDREKGLARKSRRTPQQKAAFEAERKISFKAKNADYSWAVEKANSNRRDVDSNQKSIQYWATEATYIFGLDVKADTVCKIILNGNVCLQSPVPGMAMGDEAHSCMEHVILSNINLCQRNGDIELKEATIVAMIAALSKGSTVMNIPRPSHLWRKIKTQNSVILELSKEQQSELRRQMWTTVNNIDE
jgi:hypothetical protein